MSKVLSFVHRAFDRRAFLKLAGGAAVAGVAMSVASSRSEPASAKGHVKRPTYAVDTRTAQYGRERNRYPVAKG